MSKTVSVHLGGTDYVVPMLDLDQLERVQDLLDVSPRKSGIGVLKIALENAAPKPESPGKLGATVQEIKKAVDDIMKLSGFEAPKSPNPPAPAHKPGEK